MNSHQRRKCRRYWPYQFEPGGYNWKYNLMVINWCKEQFGPMYRDRWHYRYISYDPEEIMIWFHDKKDAAWYAMTWTR